MKPRNFLLGLFALPFVRWFAAKFKLQALWRTADELSAEQIESASDIDFMRRMASASPPDRLYALQQRLLNEMISLWYEEATTTPSDWYKQPFRLD